MRALWILLLAALPAVAEEMLPPQGVPAHQAILPPAGVYPQTVRIGAYEVELVRAEARLVRNDVRHRFHVRYEIWRATWQGANAPYTTPEFDALMRIGPESIPLVIEKLLEPSEAPALALYDHLVPLEYFVAATDDELATDKPGPRLRAIRSIQRWLKLWSMQSYVRKD